MANEIEPGHRYVSLHLVAALIELGRASDALPIAEQSLREVEAVGSQGCELGLHCEARARVALALGDGSGFIGFAQRCEREYRRGRNRALRARFERLLECGRDAGLLPHAAPQEGWTAPPRRGEVSSPPSRGAVATSSEASSATMLLQTVSERLAGCRNNSERATELAKLVLEATRAQQCLLFTVIDGGLRFYAAQPPQRASAALTAALERHLHAQLQSDDTLTAVVEPIGGALETGSDEHLEPLLLQTRRLDQTQVVGIAALRYGATRYELPNRALLAAVAEALLDDDQADCVTRVD
jgi:hypothetical protein